MSDTKLTYVTLSGIPLTFTLEWPFHPSTSGADYYVLHGRIELEEGSGLHADVAVHMSQTVREGLPGVGAGDAQSPAINAIRKAVDTKNIEFLKSGKRQPISLSSRQFSVITGKFIFQNPSEPELIDFLKRKVYWSLKLGNNTVWIADPCEALYLSREMAQLTDAAKQLAEKGLVKIDGDYAAATPTLMSESNAVEQQARNALAEIDAKHAYERGAATARR